MVAVCWLYVCSSLNSKDTNDQKSNFHMSRDLPISRLFFYVNTSFLDDLNELLTVIKVDWFINLLFTFTCTTMDKRVCSWIKQAD